MNDTKNILTNILKTALSSADGKDKLILEEAMKTIKELDKFDETDDNSKEKMSKIMKEFINKAENIKEKFK